MTIGVLKAGTYNFGVAKRREEIRVLTGELLIPDGKTAWNSKTAWGSANDPLVFEEGQTIEFNAAERTSYLCFYR